VERKSDDDDWVKKCQQLVVEGKADGGIGIKRWLDCVREDMKDVWKGTISGETYEQGMHGMMGNRR